MRSEGGSLTRGIGRAETFCMRRYLGTAFSHGWDQIHWNLDDAQFPISNLEELRR